MQLEPLIQVGLQLALEYIGVMNDGSKAEPDTWTRWTAHARNVSDPDPANEMITTFDIVNITNGAIDNSWTQADLDAVKSQLQAICNDWCAHMNVRYQWTALKAYTMQFNPLSDGRPFVKSGPPIANYTLSMPGLATQHMPAQVSWTTTELTAYPRHWGRNYWPGVGSGHSNMGLILGADCDTFGAAVHSKYTVLQNSEFFPVIPVTQVEKVPTRGLLTVTAIQMDDVPDVVRRRRVKTASHRYKG